MIWAVAWLCCALAGVVLAQALRERVAVSGEPTRMLLAARAEVEADVLPVLAMPSQDPSRKPIASIDGEAVLDYYDLERVLDSKPSGDVVLVRFLDGTWSEALIGDEGHGTVLVAWGAGACRRAEYRPTADEVELRDLEGISHRLATDRMWAERMGGRAYEQRVNCDIALLRARIVLARGAAGRPII